MDMNMTNENLFLDALLDDKKVVSEELTIENEVFDEIQVTNSDNIKIECKEIPAYKIKKEFSESCDETVQEHSLQDSATDCWNGTMLKDWPLKEEDVGEIFIKEEIKEEELEGQSSLMDDSFQTGLENCLQEEMQHLPSYAKICCSHSKSETLFFHKKRKRKMNLSSIEKEKNATLIEQERTRPCEKPFKCNSCPFHTVQIWDLKRHERIHTGEKPFKCSFCPHKAAHKSALKNHERTHTGERPFKCNSCFYKAKQPGHLKTHERTHTGEKPFICSSCPYRAPRIDYLKKHERIHTGERPFKCSSCPYQAVQIGDLKKHVRTHTGERPFKCSSCSYQAKDIGNLKSHEKTHTGERPFKCSSCPYKAARNSSLKKHEKIHTGEKPV